MPEGSDHGPARLAGAARPVDPGPPSPEPGLLADPPQTSPQPISTEPEVLSAADFPGRQSGLPPAIAGAVSASRSDATRRAYSGQLRQFVARAGDTGVPLINDN